MPPHPVLRKRHAALALLFLLLPLFPSLAGSEDWNGTLLPVEQGGYNIWQQGFFRIKFMRTGNEAVPSKDANNNGCPDYVEDAGAQLAAAHHLFCHIAGFASPLESSRYAGVRHIYVVVRDKTALRGRNGLAFDEISLQPDTESADDGGTAREPRIPVLIIALSRDIDPKVNRTPTHEYFHQIQNGMTHIKNPWFYEGMAAWAERVPGSSTGGQISRVSPRQTLNSFLGDAGHKDQVFAASYGAAAMLWNPLAGLCSRANASLPEGDPVLALAYTDGSPVVRSPDLSGALLMRRVLDRLGELENVPFTRFAYGAWSEASQRAPGNNSFIVEALAGAVDELCPLEP